MSAKDVIEKILPVIDGLEWGIRNSSMVEKNTPLAKGMIQIYKKWLDTMKALHVIPIPAEGMHFNPIYHQAIMYENNPDMEENVIIEELQTGYMYEGKVLRASLVKVAN